MCVCSRTPITTDKTSSGMMAVMLCVAVRMLPPVTTDVRRGTPRSGPSSCTEGQISVNYWMTDDTLTYNSWFNICNLIQFLRCARYTSVPVECTLVPDPKDPSCCQVPKCPVKPTAGPLPTPGYVPTPVTAKPGVLTGLAPVPTSQPTPSPLPGSTPSPTLSPPLPKAGQLGFGHLFWSVFERHCTWDALTWLDFPICFRLLLQGSCLPEGTDLVWRMPVWLCVLGWYVWTVPVYWKVRLNVYILHIFCNFFFYPNPTKKA